MSARLSLWTCLAVLAAWGVPHEALGQASPAATPPPQLPAPAVESEGLSESEPQADEAAATVAPGPAAEPPALVPEPAAEQPAPAMQANPPGYYGRHAADVGGKYGRMAPLYPGMREHDGFFLRLTAGTGAALIHYQERVDGSRVSKVSERGLAALIGVSVGGRITSNLILHGDLVLTGFSDAQRDVDGTKDARDKIDGTLGLLGGGVTYYFMPANTYLTGIVGASHYSESRDDEAALDSGIGLGVCTLLGKEWWVGRRGQWALGGALRASFHWSPLEVARYKTSVRTADIGVMFGTTFN